jgi:hypothetical protein
MNPDDIETNPPTPEFDFSRFPQDSLFHERRTGHDRRTPAAEAVPDPVAIPKADGRERRNKKERRSRIDPTTFEKVYWQRSTADAHVVLVRTAW